MAYGVMALLMRLEDVLGINGMTMNAPCNPIIRFTGAFRLS